MLEFLQKITAYAGIDEKRNENEKFSGHTSLQFLNIC